MLFNPFSAHPQITHARSSVTKTTSPQVDIVHTGQLVHFAVPHDPSIRSDQVEVYDGALFRVIGEVAVGVQSADQSAIEVMEVRERRVDVPRVDRIKKQLSEVK